MLIKNIQLTDYRNYDNYSLDLCPGLNIIIGKNGIGKTNILESIIVVSNTKSFRTYDDKNLIKKDKDYLKIFINTDENNYKVVINKKNKSLYINNNLVKKTSDFIGSLNAILFKPSDLNLFEQAPSERRKLLDIEIGKVSHTYLKALLKYNLLLKEKNKLLKEETIDEILMNVIDEEMLPEIQTIISQREQFFEEINNDISGIYNKISHDNSLINIEYKKCSAIADIKQAIVKSKTKDNYYHYATYGPHHDDYLFKMNGYDLNTVASQGQKRMVLISFKFALIKYIQKQSNKIPIVLLDDIFSELDSSNQERLLNAIPLNAQIIITDTKLNDLHIDREYKVIELKGEKK